MADTITRPKPFVFVLMPFAPEFDDVYSIGIKDACKKAGAYCERLDEQIFRENMLERIYNQIAKADLIVADMTGRNPNVFYEVGYAHALGKTVILLTRDGVDIPFDLKHHYHLVYEGSITKLKEELQKRIRYHISHPEFAAGADAGELDLFINDHQLSGRPTLDVPIKIRSYRAFGDDSYPNKGIEQQYLPIQLTVHHPQKTNYETIYASLQLVAPSLFSKCMLVEGNTTRVYRSVRMPSNLIAHRPLHDMNVSPGEWDAVEFPLSTDSNAIETCEFYEFELHMIRRGPPLIFPFRINVLPPATS